MDSNEKKIILEIINDIPVEGEGGLIEFIKRGEMTLEEMKEAGLQNTKIEQINEVFKEENKEAERIEEEKRKEVDKEKELEKIKKGEYTVGQIKKFIDEGSLEKTDLVETLNMQQDHYERIKNFSKRPTQFNSWADLPPLEKNRTDIYFLGQPGSGKSCILASLFFHANQEGLIIDNNLNPKGNQYRFQLAEEIEFGVLPDSTLADVEKGVNYMPVDLAESIDEKGNINNIHPLNFVEMSGELFDKAHEEGAGGKNIGAKGYLSNNNKKLIFFVIDYDQHKQRQEGKIASAAQSSKFQNVLSYLDDSGILKRTDGIYILISKADLFPSGVNRTDYAEEFLKNNYRGFYNNCKILKNKHKDNFELTLYPFSLGKVLYKNLLVEFDKTPPNDLMQYIYDNSFVKKEKSWF